MVRQQAFWLHGYATSVSTQTYDINSQDRPVDATDHQRNCLVTATATATATGSMMTAGPGQSFVGGLGPLCGGEEGNAGEKQRLGRRCLRPCYLSLLCRVDKIAHLSRCQAKTIKVRLEEKRTLTDRKSENDIKCENILSKTEWLADVCYCTQLFHRLCCNTFRKTGIRKYTQLLA